MHTIKPVRLAISSLTLMLHATQAFSTDVGMANKHLKVAAVPWGPYLVWKCPGDADWSDDYFEECLNGEERLYKGVLWDILGFVQRATNCKFSFDTTHQDWYGSCHLSDNCTGMIGQANRGEVDFSLGMIDEDDGILSTLRCNFQGRSPRTPVGYRELISPTNYFHRNMVSWCRSRSPVTTGPSSIHFRPLCGSFFSSAYQL